MCRTPAPPSTAFVASAIWSGVGEVKISPGHAASRMPRPTNPPCIGSWPEPPPDTMPTFPCTGASARTMYAGSRLTRTRSECARAIPSSASRTTSSAALISFFIAQTLRDSDPPLADPDPMSTQCSGAMGTFRTRPLRGRRRNRRRAASADLLERIGVVGRVAPHPRTARVGARPELGVDLDDEAGGVRRREDGGAARALPFAGRAQAYAIRHRARGGDRRLAVACVLALEERVHAVLDRLDVRVVLDEDRVPEGDLDGVPAGAAALAQPARPGAPGRHRLVGPAHGDRNDSHPGGGGQERPGGIAWLVPLTAIGMIGTRRRAARSTAPERRRPTPPSRERVPSGNIRTFQRLPIRRSRCSSDSRPAAPPQRAMGTVPKIIDTGIAMRRLR